MTQHQNWFPNDVYDNEDQLEGMEIGAKIYAVSYTHLRAHETVLDLVCRLLLEKKKQWSMKQVQDYHE